MTILQGLINLNGKLVAAFKGESGDDRIFYSTWNGTGNWSNPAGTIPGKTSVGPSLGIYNGSAYAAWKGDYSDPRLFTSKYNGSSWEPQVQIPNAYSDNGPAIAQYGSTLVAAWKSVFDSTMWYAILENENGKWSTPAQIGSVGSSVGPSLAAFDNVIYAAWKGEGTDQGIYYTTYDQDGWHTQARIPSVATSVGPSLVGVGDRLYAVWKGEASDETLYYAYYPYRTGATKPWSPQNPIPASGSSIGAAIAALGSDLYAMAKGKDSDGNLHLANFNGTWSGWNNDIPGNTGPDSVALQAGPAGGRLNYTIADVNGADLTGTTVVLTVVQDIVPANPGAYSTQVNCNSPAQTGTAAPFVWQQYGFRIARSTLFAWVNCFRAEDELTMPERPLINWDSRNVANGVVALPNNTLPAGWQLTTTLATDRNNHVTGFSCVATNASGTIVVNVSQTLLSLNSKVATGNLASILNYQALLVAENRPDDGPTDTVKFISGQAIFLLTANNDVVANAPQSESVEQSNTSYSALPNSYANGEFYQEIGIGSV
jgi:hypothetical protein